MTGKPGSALMAIEKHPKCKLSLLFFICIPTPTMWTPRRTSSRHGSTRGPRLRSVLAMAPTAATLSTPVSMKMPLWPLASSRKPTHEFACG